MDAEMIALAKAFSSGSGSGSDGLGLPVPADGDAGKVPVVLADGSYGLGSQIPPPETAEVGQTIVVKAVDENGKPKYYGRFNQGVVRVGSGGYG